jgi:hypothetical protein
MATKNTIKLMKYLDVIVEAKAAAAITPGMLIYFNGTANTVAKHNHASGPVHPPMFALEDELQGKGITDAYATGDKVQCWIAQRGERVLALLADGEHVEIGDRLASNGDGFLKKHDADSLHEEEVCAIAMEHMDRSTSSGADESVTGRIDVMVI